MVSATPFIQPPFRLTFDTIALSLILQLSLNREIATQHCRNDQSSCRFAASALGFPVSVKPIYAFR